MDINTHTLIMTEVSKRTGAKRVFRSTHTNRANAVKAMEESKSRLMHPPVPSEMHTTWKVIRGSHPTSHR